MAHELCQPFLAAQGATAEPPGLAAALSAAFVTGSAAWPDIALEPPPFAAFLGHRIPDDLDAIAELRRRSIGDLYLACACLAGDAHAIRALEEHYLQGLPSLLARQNIDADVAAETVQQLRMRLLVGERPLLLAYGGTGELRGWLRVSALRAAIRAQRKQAIAKSEDTALADAALDVDLQYQRRLYETEFRAAFAEAIANLSVRERNLLKHSILYGANSDDLGALYNVHRATAARWLADARDALAADTQRRMIAKLSIDRADYDSILRLIHSQLDLSVERLLRSTPVE
jgi:RNA polymerase sigma-70 factor (ECF subfamily)